MLDPALLVCKKRIQYLVTSQSRTDTTTSSTSKPATPTASLSVTQSPDLKSQSDSEVELAKKPANEVPDTEPDTPEDSKKIENTSVSVELHF